MRGNFDFLSEIFGAEIRKAFNAGCFLYFETELLNPLAAGGRPDLENKAGSDESILKGLNGQLHWGTALGSVFGCCFKR